MTRSELLFVSLVGTALLCEGFNSPARAQQQEIIAKDGGPMVLVPAGEFAMGSDEGEEDEKPVHRVYLDAFYMDKHEVTVGQYAKFLEATGREAPPRWGIMNESRHQKRPVVNVNWSDADAYCRWAGKRLPTEAEWEKAARGTDRRIYPWGNDRPSKSRAYYHSSFFSKTEWNDHAALGIVGLLEDGKSPYGIYDMAGNVWEWTNDWYDNNYYKTSPTKNPNGPDRSDGKLKVVRGGSWVSGPVKLRSANRHDVDPTHRDLNQGFRCAKTP
jgi:formylglycine-generating enzyme required for sulfatase activity